MSLQRFFAMFGLALAVLFGGCGVADDNLTNNEPLAGDAEGPRPMMLKEKSDSVYVRLIDESGQLTKPVLSKKVVHTDAEWKALLTPEQFRIMRTQGTEPAFCGGLLKNKDDGVYFCAACKLPLFASNAKFESGTGWPSFFQPVGETNILERPDFSHGMVRTEILCPRCESHLGHLFADGPRPTGLRYCLNSESLTFAATADLKTYGEKIAQTNTAEAVIAGGCFWCVEAVFERLDGVLDVESGYAGGDAATANYKDVTTGRTGHAEAVRIVYDPDRVSLSQLLRIHFSTHDPTTLNRQGNDVGPQYRSAIFFADDDQQQITEAFIAELAEAKTFKSPIVTTLEPLDKFYPAEAYHQNYVCRNPNQGYVRAVALPKVEKLEKMLKQETAAAH
jgi:peptide methionine sulfoxide reductase msrA/msrB